MSELKVNKISPRSGTAVTLGDSGDTFTIPSGATLAIAGTVTGFTSAGIDDNATSVAITISSAEDVTFTEDILLGDSKKALFGAGSDLQIYHDGSNSYVDDTGTGRLFLRGNDRVQIQKYTGEDMISCLADGAVNLYHNNAKKFETTATGATVTGNITATGNLTSLGIDDNADATAITINSSEQVILHGGQVQSNNNTSSITYSGGSNSNAGANLTLFGGSHSSTPNVARFRSSGTEVLRILANGSVGIGLSVPEEKLHVNGTVKSLGLLVKSVNDEGTLTLQNSTTGGGTGNGFFLQAYQNDVYASNQENGKMFFRTNNTNRLTILADGKIGIGTSAPSTNLEITTTASDNGILLKSTGNTGSALDFDANRTGALNGIGTLRANWNGNGVSAIYLNAGSDTTNKDDGIITFNTRSSGTGVNPPERMRIDSSGNVYIGKTSGVLANVGHEFNAGSYASHTRDGDVTLYLNRKSSDGTIQEFRKDNSAVGSIGVASSKLHIASTGNSGIRFRDDLNSIIPCNANGSNSDNDQDLGHSGVRYRRLYLSEGVFLGGTGTANKLDDYEEGTFTPAFSFASGSIVHSAQNGVYTKVGRMVNFSAYLHTSGLNSPSGNAEITGLPFAVQGEFGGNVGIMYRWATANLVATLTPRVSGSGIQLFIGNSNVEAAHLQGSNFNGGSVKNVLLISGTYPTT